MVSGSWSTYFDDCTFTQLPHNPLSTSLHHDFCCSRPSFYHDVPGYRGAKVSSSASELEHNFMLNNNILFYRPVRYHHHHVTFAKQIERRVISIWKVVTRTTRKQPRNSYLSRDFSFVTSRRRSTFPGQLNQFY